jgi:hypothetical protein
MISLFGRMMTRCGGITRTMTGLDVGQKVHNFLEAADLYENQCLERSCLEYGINFS